MTSAEAEGDNACVSSESNLVAERILNICALIEVIRIHKTEATRNKVRQQRRFRLFGPKLNLQMHRPLRPFELADPHMHHGHRSTLSSHLPQDHRCLDFLLPLSLRNFATNFEPWHSGCRRSCRCSGTLSPRHSSSWWDSFSSFFKS